MSEWKILFFNHSVIKYYFIFMSFSFSIIISTISIIGSNVMKRRRIKELLCQTSLNDKHFYIQAHVIFWDMELLMTTILIKTLFAGLGECDNLIWAFDTVLHAATGSLQGPLKHDNLKRPHLAGCISVKQSNVRIQRCRRQCEVRVGSGN